MDDCNVVITGSSADTLRLTSAPRHPGGSIIMITMTMKMLMMTMTNMTMTNMTMTNMTMTNMTKLSSQGGVQECTR